MDNQVLETNPKGAWTGLGDVKDSILIDVRTQAEWSFVGIPDLSELGKEPILCEWASLPGMQPNPNFLDVVLQKIEESSPSTVFFLCRSGARSLAAARLVAQACVTNGREIECVNVAEGFEGDLDANGHRGQVNGWKAHALPWRQS